MKKEDLRRGMGIGGWLTNYKRFAVMPAEYRYTVTQGDEEHFDRYITEKDVAYIASQGFDHIRLGFDQVVVEEWKEPFHYRERGLGHLDDFIGWAKKHGINVVLNLHKAIGAYVEFDDDIDLMDEPALRERFTALWVMLEKRYQGETHVTFELMNEVKKPKGDAWNTLYKDTVTAIRQLNRERIIVVGGAEWNSCHRLKDLEVLEDANMVYTFHFYEPFCFTHQRGVLQPSEAYDNREYAYPSPVEPYALRYPGYKDIGDTVDKRFLARLMQDAFDFAAEHPQAMIYLGEFGTIRHADRQSRKNYLNDVIALAKEHHFAYSVWNYLSTPYDGNRFSLVDDDDRRLLFELD